MNLMKNQIIQKFQNLEILKKGLEGKGTSNLHSKCLPLAAKNNLA
jgi:hypothetical protein